MFDVISSDGYTVTALNAATSCPVGVLVTALLTQDDGSVGQDDNWGYMCVGGYCLAAIDVSASNGTGGGVLRPSRSSDFTTFGKFQATSNNDIATASLDCGVSLEQPAAADTNQKVWLKLQ